MYEETKNYVKVYRSAYQHTQMSPAYQKETFWHVVNFFYIADIIVFIDRYV